MSLPATMRAMVLEAVGQPLRYRSIDIPIPARGEVLVKVAACGVCRTDLHIADGELPSPSLPLVLGHEIVGTVVRKGEGTRLQLGERIGIPWLGWTCGQCRYCLRGQENLCENALFTGYTRNGGYAEYTLADERYCFRIPTTYSDVEAAPLLCAGLIGYRSYRFVRKDTRHLGIYGFGAAAHIIAQIAAYEGKFVYAFTRPGDTQAQSLARKLGAVWAGSSEEQPPHVLDAAIIFAPVGALVPAALRAIDKGGSVVCGGIHMSDIPSFPYSLLWGERVLRSVANLTRSDGDELLAIAPKVPVRTETQVFPLARANEAMDHLRRGQIQGAAVLVPD